MTMPKEVGRVVFGDMTAIWYEYAARTIMFALVPTSRAEEIPPHREYLDPNTPAQRGILAASGASHAGPAISAEGCLQLLYRTPEGTTQGGGFAAGFSCRGSRCNALMAFQGLDIAPDGRSATLRFRDEAHGLEACQSYSYTPGQRWLVVNTTVTNVGSEPQTMEYLASFSLGMLSLFQPGAGADCCTMMQWHSNWAGEGRLEERPVEDAGLEQSWNSFGLRARRFGARSSMPVHDFFPQLGVADNRAGVVWGASLEAFGPWQLQLSRNGDYLNLDGGLPDREFNGWRKVLSPGESLSGIPAALTCASVPAGEVAAEVLCNRLAPFAGTTPENINATEAGVPAIFNDWCKTWGKPYRDNLRPVLERLKNRGVAYLNMDFGWFQSSKFGSAVAEGTHAPDIGDWLPYPPGPEYPDGFDAWLEEVRAGGMAPGVWYEFENAVKSSEVLHDHPEWFLTQDGQLLNDGLRHFLDFRQPAVVAFLRERVIDFLREHRIGYMKVDYNSPIGSGCDGPAASPAENLRQAVAANVEFFRTLRRELPELTLELCASGGHRASAGWMRLGALASTSDAHEGLEIPLLAANTAMLVASRNNQVWATLHDWDDENRLLYSLAAGCIGRLCLSGDVDKLAPWQMALVDRALAYYEACRPLLVAGDSFIRRRLKSRSYLAPQGAQLYLRRGAQGDRQAAILHNFGDSAADSQWIVPGRWRLLDGVGMLPHGATATAVATGDGGTAIRFQGVPDFSAAAIMLAAE